MTVFTHDGQMYEDAVNYHLDNPMDQDEIKSSSNYDPKTDVYQSSPAKNMVESGFLKGLDLVEKSGYGGTAVKLYNDVVQRGKKSITEQDISQEDLGHMEQLVRNVAAKSGNNTGHVDYPDYLTHNSKLDKNILGGFEYNIDDEGNVNIKDSYDFHKIHEGSSLEHNPILEALLGTINPVGLAAQIGYGVVPEGKGVPVNINIKKNKPTSQLEEPKQVHIVRHGETTENAKDTVRGWEPVSLNERGRQEAVEAAGELKSKGVDTIVSSDLQRAKETAEIIGDKLGITPQYDPRLRTWNVGEHAGKPCETSNPVLFNYITKKSEEPVPGGESFNAFKDRSFAGIRDAVLNNKDKNLAIITHNRVEATLKGWEETGQGNPHVDLKLASGETTDPGGVRSVTFQPNATILQPNERIQQGFEDLDRPEGVVSQFQGFHGISPNLTQQQKIEALQKRYTSEDEKNMIGGDVVPQTLSNDARFNPIADIYDPRKLGGHVDPSEFLQPMGTSKLSPSAPNSMSLSEYKAYSRKLNSHITKAIKEGQSYREIAKETGLTKNAVIGRANRLGLKYDDSENLPDWLKQELNDPETQRLYKNPSQQQQGKPTKRFFDLPKDVRDTKIDEVLRRNPELRQHPFGMKYGYLQSLSHEDYLEMLKDSGEWMKNHPESTEF